MPLKSQAQRRYLWAKHPEVAREFEEHTPKGKKLPEHVEKKTAELKLLLKSAVVAAPTQGVGAAMGIPGPMKIQPQAAQPAQGAPTGIPQLPGASDHPAAQQPPQAPKPAPQPIQAQPGQPINAADAASMARRQKMIPVQSQVKAAAIRMRLIGGALKQVL